MAGLPKAVYVLLLTLGVALALSGATVADIIQTDSVVIPPVIIQTPSVVLQPAFDRIDANLAVDPADAEDLKIAFEAAVAADLFTVEQALAMLDAVQWETLADSDSLANAISAIQTILADLMADMLTDDPVTELVRLLNVLATPAGTLTAIGKAGASQEILDQVSSIAASGVPPGILVQITKKALRDGLSMEEIAAQLDALVAALAEEEDVSWGTLAHDITGEGEYQDQEQNENIDGNEEPEEESNTHGSNKSKEDDNPGQGQDKDK